MGVHYTDGYTPLVFAELIALSRPFISSSMVTSEGDGLGSGRLDACEEDRKPVASFAVMLRPLLRRCNALSSVSAVASSVVFVFSAAAAAAASFARRNS